MLKIVFGECRQELAGELLRVNASDAKRDQRPDIPEHGVPHVLRKLMDILMGEDEIQADISELPIDIDGKTSVEKF